MAVASPPSSAKPISSSLSCRALALPPSHPSTIGFYRENYRYGRGAMFYGHVIDRLEPDGTHLLQYDNRMDCLWLAGYMRAGGLNYYHKSGGA